MCFDPIYPEIDMSDFKECDWKIFYGDVKEAVPPGAPVVRGKEVDLRLYVDSDHAGEHLTRRSHTGFFIFLNMAPVIWFSKRQPTVETSVFGRGVRRDEEWHGDPQGTSLQVTYDGRPVIWAIIRIW